MNSISMLPMAAQIVECLANATTLESVSGLLKELGDMLLVSSHRSVRRIHFPLECLMHALNGHPERLQSLNFNGVKGMKFYIEHVRPVQMRLKSEASIDRIKQVVFHSMFGSNMEDFGILSAITDNAQWFNRRQLENVFKRRSVAEAKSFFGINFRLVSKLLQANPTKIMGTAQPMLKDRSHS